MISHSIWVKAVALTLLVAFKSAHADQALSVTLKADVPSVYINAELILTVELKTTLALRNGSLGRPEIKDAVIETLVDDGQEEVVENGVTQKIYKRVYAVFPSKPGKLLIPKVAFEGVVIKESNNFFPGFFSNGQRVSEESNALAVVVKDVPSTYPKGQPFLPLKGLVIRDFFDEHVPRFEVNKATTRHFEVTALGSLASSVPTINPPRVKGMQIYVEKGEMTQQLSAKRIDANVSFAHVYLPYELGSIQIPEQKVYWWNTRTDQLETVIIKPLEINVEGVANAQALPLVPEEKQPPQTVPEPRAPSLALPQHQESQQLWLVLSAIFALLWILTLIGLVLALRLLRRNKAQITKDQSETRFNMLLRKAKEDCDQKDAKKALNSLSAFYRTALKEGVTKNTSQNLVSCLVGLEDALYRYPSEQNIADALNQSKKALKEVKSDQKTKVELAPLYPN